MAVGEGDEAYPEYSRAYARHARCFASNAEGAGLAPAVLRRGADNKGSLSDLVFAEGSQAGVRESPRSAG